MKIKLFSIFILLLINNSTFAQISESVRFIRLDDKDIVIDTKSNLMWQDNSDVESIDRTWYDSLIYCEDMIFEGFSDWRVPNINEFLSIVDRSKKDKTIYDAFKKVKNFAYWTSTTNEILNSMAWHIRFETAKTTSYSKSSKYYVRCVRDIK